jgi:hypothetical protein
MPTPTSYIGEIRSRLIADGCDLTEETLGHVHATVGYRGNHKALTKLHTFTVVTEAERVDATDVQALTHLALRVANSRKGMWRGMQSGVLVLPVLVSARVDWNAVTLVRKPYRLNIAGFAALAHPVVVDTAAGSVHTFRGTRLWGFAYNGLIKKKLAAYLPELNSATAG